MCYCSSSCVILGGTSENNHVCPFVDWSSLDKIAKCIDFLYSTIKRALLTFHIHSSIHSFIHSFIHSVIVIRSTIHSSTHSFVHNSWGANHGFFFANVLCSAPQNLSCKCSTHSIFYTILRGTNPVKFH